jgi:hypothetical protein
MSVEIAQPSENSLNMARRPAATASTYRTGSDAPPGLRLSGNQPARQTTPANGHDALFQHARS